MGASRVGCCRFCIWGICKFLFPVQSFMFFFFNPSVYLADSPFFDLFVFHLVTRNHATNAYMLHALGITHVVSVGECALVPPDHHPYSSHQHLPHTPSLSPGSSTTLKGSLWVEEREGRIKVLDIKVRFFFDCDELCFSLIEVLILLTSLSLLCRLI